MHTSVMDWGIEVVTRLGLSHCSVLDIGSNASNGSFRSLFHGDYLGVDLTDGPGVDRFPRDIEAGPLPERADVVVCTEVLEHVRRPWRAVANMRESGHTLLLTCRGYDERGCWPVHHHPIDVWRFSSHGLATILSDGGWTVIEIRPDIEGPGWLAVCT